MINIIKKVKINFSFIALAVILAVTFLFLLAGNFKTYQSEISILFIPKSEKAAVHAPCILKNLTKFPRYLSFYDQVLGDNKNISDPFAGESKDERKRHWNEVLEIKQEDDSAIISVRVDQKEQSALLARQTARTLFDTASRYYNIKTDIDLRIVEGPDTVAVLGHWQWLVLLSAALGLAASFLLNFIFSGLLKSAGGRKISFDLKLKEVKQPEIKKEFKAPSAGMETAIKRSQAPANLPVGGETLPMSEEDLSGIPPASNGFAAEIPEAPKEQKGGELPEPSEEELKERLNQLLRGEM